MMKKLILSCLSFVLLTNCGDKKKENEPPQNCAYGLGLSCAPPSIGFGDRMLDCAPPPRSDEFKKVVTSLSKLEELKTKNGGSYVYSVLKTSWVADTLKRVVKVANGVVTKQILSRIRLGQNPEETEVSVEAAGEIGRVGYPATTLEQLHADCLKDTEPKLRDSRYKVFIEADATTQFLTQCTYVDTQCADDCSIGVIAQMKVE